MYPKILILLEPFNDYTGMGVTMTNLFKEWPKERIAIAANNLDIELCENLRPCAKYLALSPAIKVSQRKYSGSGSMMSRLKKAVRKVGGYFIRRLGLFDYRHIALTSDLLNLIDEFKPEIIFSALGSLDRIRFVDEISSHYPEAKLALYIVDDWPNTRQNGRWFPSYWRKKYDTEFRKLLNKAAFRFSICQDMSDSYKQQYGKNFQPFHNPVDVEEWINTPKQRHYSSNIFSIVYVGKINRDTKDTIFNLASVVDSVNEQTHLMNFDVYSPSPEQIDTSLYKGFHILPPVPNSDIPALLKGYDALFLTLGFSKESKDYTKLSMPTKLTEYLSAGAPILLNAPAEIAVTKYVRKHEAALICDSDSINDLREAVTKLLSDTNLRQRIVENASALAKHHDLNIVRENFRIALTQHN